MILDCPTHRLMAYVGAASTDTYGNEITVPSTVGVEVRCRVTPVSVSRDRSTSRVTESYKVITGDTSTARWIRVRFDDKWFSVLEWKLFNSSPSTSHVEATIAEEA